jgi:hypothetical protein
MGTFIFWAFVALFLLFIFVSLVMKIVSLVFWKVIVVGALIVFLWKKFKKKD